MLSLKTIRELGYVTEDLIKIAGDVNDEDVLAEIIFILNELSTLQKDAISEHK